MEKVKRIQWRISTLSSLQVDSISSMGGGHVDGAGKVVQFKCQESGSKVTFNNTGWNNVSILDTTITPAFSNSLILIELIVQLSVGTATNVTSAGIACRIKSGNNVIGGSPNNQTEFYYTKAASSDPARIFARYSKSTTEIAGSTTARTYSFDVAQYFSGVGFDVNNMTPATSIMKVWEIAQ